MSAAGMDVRNVKAMSQPAIRAVLLCRGDCSGREIVLPVLYVRSSGDSSRWHACATARRVGTAGGSNRPRLASASYVRRWALPSVRWPAPTTAASRPQPRSRLWEVGEEDHSGVEPLHVVELHPDGSPVAEHVDVSLAPDQRVQVDLVLVDQALLGQGIRELAAPVHEQVTVDLVLQPRDRVLEVLLEQGRVPLQLSGQGGGPDVLRHRVDHVRPLARLARPISRQPLVGLAAQHQPAGSRLTLERVAGVVSVRLHPLADRVYDAVDGGLRGRDQPSHLDSPSVTGARSEPPLPIASNEGARIRRSVPTRGSEGAYAVPTGSVGTPRSSVRSRGPEATGSGCLEPPSPTAATADSSENTPAIASTPLRAWRGIPRPAAHVAPKSTASQIAAAASHGRAEPSSRVTACRPPRPSTKSRAPTARASNLAPGSRACLPIQTRSMRVGFEKQA